MVIPPPERAARVTRFLEPYLLRMHFTNKRIPAMSIHMKMEQKYDEKVKSVIDSVNEAGVKLL
ncbi:hypothetical protein BAE44_0014676 [Dichanthelium oligosanthes]|uniref:Uncharacterized protein n=1 Tax=Dichanthelium oligosanthes TaxID=888268 RepID=A0A1E5VGW3_9POAL|nr:hypothetical protein BAE44_0014676 [Dichanthelium oligosanthes]